MMLQSAHPCQDADWLATLSAEHSGGNGALPSRWRPKSEREGEAARALAALGRAERAPERAPAGRPPELRPSGSSGGLRSTEDTATVLSLGSPAPSTVDLHGPASLSSMALPPGLTCKGSRASRHNCSVPSLLSGGGHLELSDSLSTHSLAISSNSSARPSPSSSAANTANLNVGSGCRRALAASGRTPELASRDVRCCSGNRGRKREAYDENSPPDDSLPTPRTFQVQSSNLQLGAELGHLDPLARTVKVVTTVTTMRSFWENQTRNTLKEVTSPKEALRPRRGSGNSGRGGNVLRSATSVPASRRGGAVNRMERDVARTRKQLEGTSALLEELAQRLYSTDAEVLLSPKSSDSDSEVLTDVGTEELDDEEIAFLRAYQESSSVLWKVQRQTVRLLLAHLDKVGSEHQDVGALCSPLSHMAGFASPIAALAATGSPLCSPGRTRQELDGARLCESQHNPRLLRRVIDTRDGADSKVLEEPAREPDIMEAHI